MAARVASSRCSSRYRAAARPSARYSIRHPEHPQTDVALPRIVSFWGNLPSASGFCQEGCGTRQTFTANRAPLGNNFYLSEISENLSRRDTTAHVAGKKIRVSLPCCCVVVLLCCCRVAVRLCAFAAPVLRDDGSFPVSLSEGVIPALFPLPVRQVEEACVLPCPSSFIEHLQFETLCVSNPVTCRVAEKRGFPLTSGKAALSRVLPLKKAKRSSKTR